MNAIDLMTGAQVANVAALLPGLSGSLRAALPENKVHELRRIHGDVLDGMEAILAKAETAGRNLEAREDSAFQGLKTVVSDLETKIVRAEADSARKSSLARPIGGGHLSNGKGPIYRTGDGREIRGVLNTERLQDTVEHNLPDGIRPEELSLGRLIRGAVTGNYKHAQAELRAAQSEGVNTAGGFMVPSPLSTKVIDLARNKTRLFQAGAITVPLDSDSLSFAVLTQDGTASWRGENTSGLPSMLGFGLRMMNPRTVMVLVKSSIEVMEDAPNIEQVIEGSISAALALEVDRAFMYGDQTNGQPIGLKNWTAISNVQTITSAANGDVLIDYSKFSSAYQKIEEANGDETNISMIAAPRTFSTLERIATGIAGDKTPLDPPDSWATIKKFSTNQVPINLTQGASSVATDVFMGDFSKMLIGIRTAVTMEVSREAADQTNSAFRDLQVWIRAYARMDMILEQPAHFVIASGIVG